MRNHTYTIRLFIPVNNHFTYSYVTCILLWTHWYFHVCWRQLKSPCCQQGHMYIDISMYAEDSWSHHVANRAICTLIFPCILKTVEVIMLPTGNLYIDISMFAGNSWCHHVANRAVYTYAWNKHIFHLYPNPSECQRINVIYLNFLQQLNCHE